MKYLQLNPIFGQKTNTNFWSISMGSTVNLKNIFQCQVSIIDLPFNIITERVTFKETDLCVTASLSVNGRLFISPREHIEALV